jgi:hypothetical protein
VPDRWPPEDVEKWIRSCEALRELPNLQELVLDVKVRDIDNEHYDHQLARTLQDFLKPLQGVKAHRFEIEINIDLSQEIRHGWGDINFVTVRKERPDNVQMYGRIPRLVL